MGSVEGSISVVIPTRNRAHLVGRAVRSALAQTLTPLEVIVVIDGPDENTAQELAQFHDSRLIVEPLPSSVCAAEARNAGVRVARGPWIAFLDDDDEWLPEKLELQMVVARESKHSSVVVGTRLIQRTPDGDSILPRRLPLPSESVGEYLFRRKSFREGDALIQTSTFLTTKDLLTRVPWRRGAHDDWDWLLRAAATDEFAIELVPTPLAIWHSDAGRARLSEQGSWRVSLEWWRSMRSLVDPATYASFLLYSVSQWAHAERDWRAPGVLLWEALRNGRPTPTDSLLHVGRWVLPRQVRQPLKTALMEKLRLT